MKPAKPELLSTINKTQILYLLRTHGALSRASIVRELGVAFPTVSSNIKSLMDLGVVEECGAGENELGRKSKLVRCNCAAGYVIGGDIGRNSIRIVLSDMCGAVVSHADVELHSEKRPDSFLDKLDQAIDQMLDKAGILVEQVLYVCIGVPYRVGSASQASYLQIPSANGGNIRLDQYFTEKFLVPIRVENSINLGALGEKFCGAGSAYRNILFINFGIGVGSALILNDRLFSGFNGAAGEISYSVTDGEKLRTAYHDDGLLEQAIADAGKRIGLECDENNHILQMKPAFDRADEGDPAARQFLNELMRRFGILLINAVSLLNPEAVIFAGGVGVPLLERYYSDFLRMLTAHVPYVPRLLSSSLGKKSTCLGAVNESLDYLFSDYTILEKALKKQL